MPRHLHMAEGGVLRLHLQRNITQARLNIDIARQATDVASITTAVGIVPRGVATDVNTILYGRFTVTV
jgi:hypothetical protein